MEHSFWTFRHHFHPFKLLQLRWQIWYSLLFVHLYKFLLIQNRVFKNEMMYLISFKRPCKFSVITGGHFLNVRLILISPTTHLHTLLIRFF